MTLLAIVAIHTAANEPPKVRQVMNKIHRANVGDARAAARRHPGPPGEREVRAAGERDEAWVQKNYIIIV